jgi:hypothetical protein
MTHHLAILCCGVFIGACGAKPSGTGGTDTEAGDTSGGEGGDFAFASDEPSAYTRVDRAGMPAINTAVIASKDDYNQAGPKDDANGDFVPEITDIITVFHDALDDDLTALMLTPCAPADCVAQAAPLVVPDTLKVDPSAAAGFPNGRMLPDNVIDVTLAVVLLDLSVEGQTPTTFVEFELGPQQNDKAFLDEFPYLAPPHE